MNKISIQNTFHGWTGKRIQSKMYGGHPVEMFSWAHTSVAHTSVDVYYVDIPDYTNKNVIRTYSVRVFLYKEVSLQVESLDSKLKVFVRL
jgi:hypothetical protein